MNATKIIAQPPGGERIPIAKLVPLDTPLLMQIFPIYACNFKCKYCEFSIPVQQRDFISNEISMDINLYKKIIDESIQFPGKIKVLRFVGMGEPLLHKSIVDMVQYASQSNKFERIEILTNGYFLSHNLADQLINAGLTQLLISIQGTTPYKYKQISNIHIDWKQFLENIKYFYKNRGNTKLHIKIIDCALDDNDDKTRFFYLFGDMCDTIGIENVGPIYPGVKYNEKLKCDTENQYGVLHNELSICSQSFYSIQINPDGNVVPCYSIKYPAILGNCYTDTITNIWGGTLYNNFRLKMLDGIDNMCDICKNCDIFKHRSYNNDDLSSKTQELKEYYAKSS